MSLAAAVAAPPRFALPPEPYPGLRPFDRQEHRIFFGREEMIDTIIDLLARNNLVVVHGASGSGKSSIVRAGVLPWLELQQSRGGTWLTKILRPAGGPLRNLAAALAGALGPAPRPPCPCSSTIRMGRNSAGRCSSHSSRSRESWLPCASFSMRGGEWWSPRRSDPPTVRSSTSMRARKSRRSGSN